MQRTKEKLWTKEYIAALGIMCSINITMNMLTSTLAIYGKGISNSTVYAGMLLSAFTLAALATRLFTGIMFRKLSIKGILILGIIVSLIASGGYIIFVDPTMFVIARIIHGIGFGITSTATATAISTSLPKSRLLEGIGYSGMVATVCMALGPSISLSISKSDYTLFYKVFNITFALLIISLVLALLLNIKDVPKSTKNVDGGDNKVFGAIVLFFAILYFFTIIYQSSINAFLSVFAMEKNLGNISLYFTFYAIASFSIRLFMTKLVDKFTEKRVIKMSYFIVGLCLIGIAFVNKSYMLFLIALPYGAAAGLLGPIVNVRMLSAVSDDKQGSVNALYYASIDAGYGLGALIWSGVASVAGYSIIYILAGIMALMCLSAFSVFSKKNIN